MTPRRRILMLMLVLLTETSRAAGTDSRGADRGLAGRFPREVRPFLDTYCLDCHGPEKPKGDLDLSPFTSAERVGRDLQRWDGILERLEAGEMPPKKAAQHPTPAQSRAVIAWIEAFRNEEARRHAGDPGPVLARRLSNAEYDNSIRDLTGIDLRPTREFPVDPANPEGFDNSGESLGMSPALLKKYLGAAREVSRHAVLTLDGIAFADHPMMVHTDRDKYGILRIVEFYERQPTDYADYFAAAWRYRHRAALGRSRVKLSEIAADAGISSNYLALVWETLNTREDVGPIAHLQSLWNALPAPVGRSVPAEVQSGCVAMRDFVVSLRPKIRPDVPNLSAPGLNPSAQALVLWKDRRMAALRRSYDTNTLQIEGVVTSAPESRNTAVSYNKVKVKPKAPEPDPHLAVPSDPAARARYEAAFARFAAVFPDAFYVKERGRTFVDPEEEKANGNVGRLLSAGLHNQTGYFRDDGPLYEMILDESGRRELDRLWDEFLMVASVPQRMHQSTVYFERTDSRFLSDAEFDFARAEDKDCTSESKVRKLAELYYAKAKRTGASEQVLAAIQDHFERVDREIRRIETLERAAEPKHLEALVRFAQRAYRRPLTSDERGSLLAFYQTLRDQDGLTHDDAIRDCLASVLMSPHFSYRFDLVEAAGAGVSGSNTRTKSSGPAGTVPLSDNALASRLSYFLWSSIPDERLLARAAAGDLHRPKVLIAEARRMMADPRIRALALEFGGHWLDFRRFEEHNAVDRARFPSFDDALREAMFEEPVRFLQDVIQSNRPVTLLLDAPYTFVNPVLARHYGLDVSATTASNAWVRADDARSVGRGGLLPMSVFLTANSPGLRTSPVKRGNWVARRILGERIPPPPAAVPELPSDEAKLGELTLRETLARHRADPACAACHERFDSLGLVFEGFGPIGERRSVDLAGHPVDTQATFPRGGEGSGVEGLRTYIHEKRQDDFLDTLCRKLLSYALGRSLILSDEITVRDMRTRLKANGYRFDSLVETIVTSPQFLNRRDPGIPPTP
ncbi:MAG: DUF1592 domain-containing protein [Verrucomicrobiales bacterium]|nr:DUF1592 domain-containing protein [Verrucomicrobiales bacterium]